MNQDFAYGMWVIVIINVGLFVFFILSFMKPKASAEWRNMGVVAAFFVALFTEMYGFPLTIYLLTGWLGEAYPVLQPFNHKYGHLWVVAFGGSTLAWVLIMTVSLLLLIAGYMLMSRGWRQIHAAHEQLVTDGLYAYARHPQYTGLFLVIAGFLIQWPTFLTVIMAPVLYFAYYRLSLHEEQVVQKHFGNIYKDYVVSKPMFFPEIDKWSDFLKSSRGRENLKMR